MGDCAAKITAKQIGDVQSGLGFFGKLGQLLMCTARVSDVKETQSYVEPITKPPTDAKTFDALYAQNKEDYEEKNYNSESINPNAKLEANVGYQPEEMLKGYIL